MSGGQTSNSAEGRDFFHGGAEIVQIVMRIFAVLAFAGMAGELHTQFRRHVLIGERGCEAVAQGMERTLGKHLIAFALDRLCQERLDKSYLLSFINNQGQETKEGFDSRTRYHLKA